MIEERSMVKGGVINNPRTSRRDFIRMSSAAAVLARSSLGFAQKDADKYVLAETVHGKVRGTEVRGVKIFKGISYGATTEGKNRFMPPLEPPRWTGIRDTLEYGKSSPQYDATQLPTHLVEGEDCLALNIWTPGLNDGVKRPVMIWLHGGGFRYGSGSSPSNDGTNLVLRGDVVVVTINHRLNVMGFVNLSDFSPDFAASGQVGMLDIVQALKWVQANITNFGGDPNSVTIFGQSGGGRKCEVLLAMPSAKGLFHRAAIESGIAMRVVDRAAAVRNAERLLSKLSLSKKDVHKIQQTPLDQIMAAHSEINRELGGEELDILGFAPSVDGSILPQHPFYPVASQVSPEVPVLIGFTRTEFTGLNPIDSALFNLDESGMRVQVKKLLGEKSTSMVELYRTLNPGATPSDIFFLIASDYRYGALSMKIAERRAALKRAPVYMYYFTWESPVQGRRLRTPHGAEIPFVFDNVKISSASTGGGAKAMALADRVSDAWLAFARTGNPNTSKMPYWAPFDDIDRSTMVIDDQPKPMKDPLQKQRVAMFGALNLD
jgi:para-nitrobenzyl esterase